MTQPQPQPSTADLFMPVPFGTNPNAPLFVTSTAPSGGAQLGVQDVNGARLLTLTLESDGYHVEVSPAVSIKS